LNGQRGSLQGEEGIEGGLELQDPKANVRRRERALTFQGGNDCGEGRDGKVSEISV